MISDKGGGWGEHIKKGTWESSISSREGELFNIHRRGGVIQVPTKLQGGNEEKEADKFVQKPITKGETK